MAQVTIVNTKENRTTYTDMKVSDAWELARILLQQEDIRSVMINKDSGER